MQLNTKEVRGELDLWRACLKQHIMDLILPQSRQLYRGARDFLYGANSMMPCVCLFINTDANTMRRKILILYRAFRRMHPTKSPTNKSTKLETKKVLSRLVDELVKE